MSSADVNSWETDELTEVFRRVTSFGVWICGENVGVLGLVIHPLLVRIRKDVVRRVYFFEYFGRLWVCGLVRVVLHGQLVRLPSGTLTLVLRE